jgi:hypothetical protein
MGAGDILESSVDVSWWWLPSNWTISIR